MIETIKYHFLIAQYLLELTVSFHKNFVLFRNIVLAQKWQEELLFKMLHLSKQKQQRNNLRC